jgi:hypothetical protein
LGQIDLVQPFYLAGDTALALRLGHRVSVDLDLFLYVIASHVPLDELFASSGHKYPHSPGFDMCVFTALVDFDIANRQEEPILLQAVEWEQVKAFFMTEARRLGQNWLNQS